MRKLFLFWSLTVVYLPKKSPLPPIILLRTVDELGANKLAVDINGVAVLTEYAAMNNGDAHIEDLDYSRRRSNMLMMSGNTSSHGTLLVKGKAGICIVLLLLQN